MNLRINMYICIYKGLVNSMADSTIDATLPKAKRQRLSKVISLMESDESSFEVFVAVKQGNILATSFHPELTEDIRWHR
jgi:glutamine amidotransferase PdxT